MSRETITHYTNQNITKGPYNVMLTDEHMAFFKSLNEPTIGYSPNDTICMYARLGRDASTDASHVFDDIDFRVTFEYKGTIHNVAPWTDQDGKKCYMIRLNETYSVHRSDTLLFKLSPSDPIRLMDVVR